MRYAFMFVICCFALSSCGGPDLLVRVDQPISLSEARKRAESDFPFPPTAHGIYCAFYGDWQVYESIVRFEAPPADCEATIARAINWVRKSGTASSGVEIKPFEGLLPSSTLLKPVPWFDEFRVNRGVYVEDDRGNTVTIWVDLDAGRFFYRFEQ